MVLNILIFIFACLVLTRSAQIAVRSLEKIAVFFGLSEFSVGFILMAIATSIPELFVGVSSAIAKVPILSLGNIIGSNIVDLTLIGGLVAFLLKGIKFEGKIERLEIIRMLFISFLSLILMLDKELSKIDGCVLLLIYLSYLYNLLKERKIYRKILRDEERWKGIFKAFLYFILSIFGLIFGARLIIVYGVSVASIFSIPLVLVGLLAVAFSTCLPELTFEYHAVKTRHEGMALGDLLGSVITNSALILGLVAIISPIQITEYNLFLYNAGFLSAALLLFSIFASRKEGITRMEGLGLLIFYFLFLVFNIFYVV